MKKAFISFLLFTSIGVPMAASAASNSVFWNFKDSILSCTANDPKSLPPGPDAPQRQCQNFCDILETGQRILKALLSIALLIIAPIMFLIGGIMIMVARGSTEQYSAGVKTITGAAAGVALILVSFVIVNTFFYFVSLKTDFPGAVSPTSWFKIQCTVPASS